jgi:hypothetical protein
VHFTTEYAPQSTNLDVATLGLETVETSEERSQNAVMLSYHAFHNDYD